MEHKVCAEWPEILCPAPGCALPLADTGKNEIALVANSGISRRKEGPAGQIHAFNVVMRGARAFDFDLGSWQTEMSLEYEIDLIRPTILWMQIQYGPSPVSAEFITAMKRKFGLTVVLWDGDQHYEPSESARSWFIELGRVCDMSLVKNTKHPYEYRKYGVRHPGYLGQGCDVEVMKPPTPEVVLHLLSLNYPDVVMTANAYPNLQYAHRDGLIWALRQHYKQRFGLYGIGWPPRMEASSPVFDQAAALVYHGAKAAISISIRDDLPRYTSNRLLNIMASGGVALVERFPDCEGMGLVDEFNCLLWSGLEQLKERIDWVCAQPRVALEPMRRAAREWSLEHSWEMQVRKLMAMINAVRA